MRRLPATLLLAAALLLTGCDVEVHTGQAPTDVERVVQHTRKMLPRGTDVRLLQSFRSEAGLFVFTTAELAHPGERVVPEMSYRVPTGRDGGTRFVAVGNGRNRGWALDVWVLREPGADVIYGATIPQAAQVRYPLRGGGRGLAPVLPVHENDGYRYVVARLPPGTVADDAPAAFAALDVHGRLLGRMHWNDGHGGFGAMDGSHDRAALRRRAG